MVHEFSRTELLIEKEGLERLRNATVMVLGVGGVGSHCIEALARSGVGKIDIFDMDTVSLSNINRQIIALHSTVGRHKTEVMKERIADINPDCKVVEYRTFYLPENADEFDFSLYKVCQITETIKDNAFEVYNLDYFSTPNLYTVTCLYVSPGQSTTLGKCWRLGESGKCCASKQIALRLGNVAPCAPAKPLCQFDEYTWTPGSVVYTSMVRPLTGSVTLAAKLNSPTSFLLRT